MRHLSTYGARRWTKGAALTLLVAVASLASPFVAVGAAQAGGADKPQPATFGDCTHNNAGVHNGYDCEVVEEEPT
jgi:hypothetical protein